MPRLVALGGLALLGPEGPLPGSAARGRNLALLALLVRAGETGLTREKLASYLWPESDAERSRHSLDQALYTLRRALGADVFSSAGTTLAVDHRILESDVAEFGRALAAGFLRPAADLYAGPFLDGFHISDAVEFERWVDRERAALHADYIAALERLAREVSAAEGEQAAIREWRRLAAADPLSSRVTLELMRVLEATGDSAGAIQASHVHTTLVKEQLDAFPDPAVLEYADRLRHAPVQSAVTSAREAAPPPARSHAAFAYSAPPVAAGARRKRRILAWLSAGAVFAAAAAIASRTPIAGHGPAGSSSVHRVAVASFENGTGDPSLDAVGRMAAAWIEEGLVRTGLVQVIEPDAAGRAASSVVAGQYYMANDTLWLHARITDPGSGIVQHALDAVPAVSLNPSTALEPLRQQVLGALGALYDPRLNVWVGGASRPPSYAAYQEFAAGIELHAVPRDLAGAADRFRRATQLDPDYLMPHLWLAWTLFFAGEYARADSAVAALAAQRQDMSPVERAWHDRLAASLAGDNEASYRAARRMAGIAPRSAAVMALANAALDTNRPGVAIAALEEVGIESLGLEREHGWFLLTAGYHMLGEHRRELEAAERAIRSVGLGWAYTGPGVPALAALGRAEAIERRLAALEHLPPLDNGVPPAAGALLAAVAELRAHGLEDEAVALADRHLARERESDAGAHAEPARWAHVQLLYELGRWDDAARTLGEPPADGRAAWRHRAMAGLIAARRGDFESAHRTATDLASIDTPWLFGEPTFWRARLAAALREEDRAITLIRQAFAEGLYSIGWHLLHVSRDFDGLRELRAFQELIAPTG